MAKPFGNMAQLTGDILDSYIMGLQAGSTPDDAGLDEMKYVRVDKLRRYIREGLVTAYTPRENSSSATPSSPQVGDIFMCTGAFTESGVTYQLNHFYVYTTQLAWEDITAGIKGPKGDTGATPLLSVGEVTYGDTPTVTIDTTDPAHPVMNFVLKTSEVGVVDNLTSDSSVDALSAKQGRLLKQETTALQSQIVNINSEVDNIEALIGGDVEVVNIDPAEGESLLAQSRLIHHANLLPNGNFGRVGARAVSWNQQIKNGDFDGTSNWDSINYPSYETINANNNEMTVSVVSTSVANGISQVMDILGGHTYLVCAEFYPSSVTTVKISSQGWLTQTLTANSWNRITYVKPVTTALSRLHFYIDNGGVLGAGSSVKIRNVMLFDLTAMNEASLTADQFRAKFPASYYPTDTGHIYDLNPSGFRIRGINLWDEVSEIGNIDASTGQNDDTVDTLIRSKNYYEVSATDYYALLAGKNARIFFYDANKTYLSYYDRSGDGSFTVPSGACYIRFRMNTAYGTTYNHDIQIADNTLPSSVKTVYHPYSEQTVPVSISGHYVNENCFDYVTNKTVNGILRGEVHTKVGVYTFTGSESLEYASQRWRLQISGIKRVAIGADIGNLMLATYLTTSTSILSSDKTQKYVAVDNSSDYVYFVNPNALNSGDLATMQSDLAGKVLYFELATEVVTYGEPLRSFSVSDYCTIEPITPQTIANRADVPFSVLSKSNNGLIEQIRTNTADIADNKSILSQHEARIENLEEAHGSYHEVDVKSVYTIPLGKGKNWIVDKLRGVTRGRNNLHEPTVFSTTIGGGVAANSTNEGYFTLSGTASNADQYGIRQISLTIGHKYLIANCFAQRRNGGSWVANLNSTDMSADIFDTTGWNSGDVCTTYVYVLPGTTYNVSKKYYPIITDLNIYFDTSDLSFLGSTDAQKLATIQTNYPWLLTPSSYGTSMVKTRYEGFKSISRNLLNPSKLNGAGTWSDGKLTTTPSALFNTTLTDGWSGISFIPNTQYYLRAKLKVDSSVSSLRLQVNYTDNTTSSSSGVSGGGENYVYITTTSGKSVKNVLFNYSSGGSGTAIVSELIINKSDSKDGTYTPWFSDTLTFPSPISLKSAGAVAEEAYLNEDGEAWKTNPLKTVKFSSFTWVSDGGTVYRTSIADMRKPLNSSAIRIACMPKMISIAPRYSGATSSMPDMTICQCADTSGTTDKVYIKLASGISLSDLANEDVTYELATPDADTPLTPILNNLIATEAGGTIESILTTPVDDSMTLGYINL